MKKEVLINTEMGELTVVVIEDEKGKGYSSFFKDARDDMFACGNNEEEAVRLLKELLTTVIEYERKIKIL